jgi:DNA-directed RNA polymerase II subunit RPB1
MTSYFLYNSNITKIGFSLTGDESILQDSYVPIRSFDLFSNNKPYENGVYDAHLGTTDHSYKCQTCHNDKKSCLGHEGHIVLNYPVWNPFGIVDGRKWLKLICFECGHPIIKDDQYMHYPRKRRLDEASKIARGTNKKCVHCTTVHPIIKKKVKKEPLVLTAEILEDKKQIDKRILYPHICAQIFALITDETVEKLGKSIDSHPRHFILSNIRVPSVAIRPDVKKIGGGRSTNDELTTMLQVIIKKNEVISRNNNRDTIDQKAEKAIFELNNAYYDFVRAGGVNSMKSLAVRLKGKEGRFRKNQMGKHTRNMCRSTITGDPRIPIDGVGVPITFARIIQYEEVVQEFNKKRLLSYVMNGRSKYPGATKIIRKSGGEYDVDTGRDKELEVGDIVLRDMINGDPVNFNRQPSLMPCSMCTHWAIIILDPSIKTLLMNVIVCALYNADFDGDQMNLIISSSIATRNEITELSSLPNWFVSYTTSAPAIGQADDSIIGLAELTRSNVKFDKYHAMLLYCNNTYIPNFAGDSKLTGRECISKLLTDTPINFSRFTKWYVPDMAHWIDYDPTEIKVKIEKGRLLSGVLDKASIGKGTAGSLNHIISSEYGAGKAIEVMFNMQQMAIAYMMQFGYTIGIMDIMISDESKEEVDKIATDIINKSRLITEKLNNGDIIPPIGKTVEEFYEEQQLNTLKVVDDFTEILIKSIDVKSNNLFKLIAFGSKGELSNMFNIASSIGQKAINGERIRQKFGFKRTLAYYPRFDTSPESRGYIANSYLSGMTSPEYIANSMAARFDLISKALSTSITGDQNRKSIKSLESTLVNNYRWTVKNMNIISLSYGENLVDPRRLERVQFPTVMISDEEFTQVYLNADFPEVFNQMRNDRQEYRRIFTIVEQMNIKELMRDERMMPVNVARIVDEYISSASDKLADKVKYIQDLCKGIPYVLINEIQERLSSPVPEHLQCMTWLLCMLIRSYLHPNVLGKITMENLVIICDRIRLKYSQSLIEPGSAVGIIAAQSFSEPLTQYMLDAHHRSSAGGTTTSGMVKTKEILGAKDVPSLYSPNMYIPVLPQYMTNRAKVQEIANSIEVMKLRQFVILWETYFEKYGEPVHSATKHEVVLISEFARLNPLITPPGDLIKWCIRIVLNKTMLILKNITLEYIVVKIREIYPDLYLVYSPENSKQIVLRVYMRNTLFKKQISRYDILKIKDTLLDTTIRGIDGIINANVVKMIRTKTADDNSIQRHEDIWCITTTGTNLRGILTHPFVDKYKIHTDAIQEIYRTFGIEAARQKIISEMRSIIDKISICHFIIYADEMTYTGNVTSIESGGLRTRETNNILLRIGFTSPIVTLEEAAVNSMEDVISGVTGYLLIGSVPRIGTLYNSFHINEEFVRANVKRPDDILQALFD